MGFMVISIGGGHDHGDLVVMGMMGFMVISIGGAPHDHDYVHEYDDAEGW